MNLQYSSNKFLNFATKFRNEYNSETLSEIDCNNCTSYDPGWLIDFIPTNCQLSRLKHVSHASAPFLTLTRLKAEISRLIKNFTPENAIYQWIDISRANNVWILLTSWLIHWIYCKSLQFCTDPMPVSECQPARRSIYKLNLTEMQVDGSHIRHFACILIFAKISHLKISVGWQLCDFIVFYSKIPEHYSRGNWSVPKMLHQLICSQEQIDLTVDGIVYKSQKSDHSVHFLLCCDWPLVPKLTVIGAFNRKLINYLGNHRMFKYFTNELVHVGKWIDTTF